MVSAAHCIDGRFDNDVSKLAVSTHSLHTNALEVRALPAARPRVGDAPRVSESELRWGGGEEAS